MPDVEDNMDELFRRAAEGYPLKNSKDDWDNIAPLLEDNTGVAAATLKRKSIKKYSFLLLALSLLLFIATFIANYSWNKKVLPLTGQTEGKILVEELKGNDNSKIAKAVIVPVLKNNIKQQLLNNNTNYVVKHIHPDAYIKNITGFIKKSKYQYNSNNNVNEIKRSGKIMVTVEPEINEKISPQKVSYQIEIIKKNNPNKYAANNFVLNKSILPLQLPGKKDDIEKEKKVKAINKEKIKKQQGVYVGFMFGASFNQIKTQGLKKPGYDIGIVAGYQINKSLSVETGLMYDKKYYFSSGKYFDLSKVSSSMPADMKVISMEGSCAIFEIPVKIKYNLRSKGNTSFYSTAGISTYIISNEYNKYRAVTNGTAQNITGTYNNTSRYFAAALNLSLGYQSKIGSLGNILIEPYVQMPLKGIGVGSLSVMTAGLHIGFTRFIH